MIEEGMRVSLEYTLTLDDGSMADTNVGGEPLTYEHGGGQILPALELALVGLAVDATKTVKLSPEEGYGPVQEAGFQPVPTDVVPEEARTVGTLLVAKDDSGEERPIRVHEVGEEEIIIDFNHPLAGQSLTFEIKVLSVESVEPGE